MFGSTCRPCRTECSRKKTLSSFVIKKPISNQIVWFALSLLATEPARAVSEFYSLWDNSLDQLVVLNSKPTDESIVPVSALPNWPSLGPLPGARLDYSRDGRLFAVFNNTGVIREYDFDTGFQADTYDLGFAIEGIAAQSNGQVFVHRESVGIYEVDFDAKSSSLVAPLTFDVDGIDFDDQGNLVGSDLNESGQVYRIPLDGSDATSLGSFANIGAGDITFSEDDSAFYFWSSVTEELHRLDWASGAPDGSIVFVKKFDGIGRQLGIATRPGYLPCDFDRDGDCDADDADALTGVGNLPVGIPIPPAHPKFDLTNDNVVDTGDLTEWREIVGVVNEFGGPVKPGDTNVDNDVDTDDLTRAIINYTGAGATTKVWSQGDNDGDGDTDTVDLTTAITNFTGVEAANPDVPNLIYDPDTGNVTIDADGADVISFSLQSGPFNAADFSELPAGLTDNIATQIGWTSFNLFTGLTGTADLGAILPAGLDEAQMLAALTTASYGLALSGGGGGGTFDIIIPEPGTMVLLCMGGLMLTRRRGCEGT